MWKFSFRQKTRALVLDLLFPVRCLRCRTFDTWLCNACSATIPLQIEHVCPACEKNPTPHGEICFTCYGKNCLDGLLPATSYQNKLVRALVHKYKYGFLSDLHIPLGKLLCQTFSAANLPLPQLIIPVPLHPRRLRWRGFNQAQLLAGYLSTHLTPGFPIPVANKILLRQKYTKPQMKVRSYQQRQANIAAAFTLTNKAAVQDKYILLVDDVATTGATLFECASMLKTAGAKKVFALVIARQNIQKP